MQINNSIFQSFVFLIFFFNTNIFAKPIYIDGISKLNLSDIEVLTDFDIYSNDYDIIKVNELIKDLYNSDLIYDVKLTETDDLFSILIEEYYNRKYIYKWKY